MLDLKRASESLVAANLSVLGGPTALSTCVAELQHFSAVWIYQRVASCQDRVDCNCFPQNIELMSIPQQCCVLRISRLQSPQFGEFPISAYHIVNRQMLHSICSVAGVGAALAIGTMSGMAVLNDSGGSG